MSGAPCGHRGRRGQSAALRPRSTCSAQRRGARADRPVPAHTSYGLPGHPAVCAEPLAGCAEHTLDVSSRGTPDQPPTQPGGPRVSGRRAHRAQDAPADRPVQQRRASCAGAPGGIVPTDKLRIRAARTSGGADRRAAGSRGCPGPSQSASQTSPAPGPRRAHVRSAAAVRGHGHRGHQTGPLQLVGVGDRSAAAAGPPMSAGWDGRSGTSRVAATPAPPGRGRAPGPPRRPELAAAPPRRSPGRRPPSPVRRAAGCRSGCAPWRAPSAALRVAPEPGPHANPQACGARCPLLGSRHGEVPRCAPGDPQPGRSARWSTCCAPAG